jgi:hypothetical protein
METVVPLSCSQEPTFWPYPEPEELGPHSDILLLQATCPSLYVYVCKVVTSMKILQLKFCTLFSSPSALYMSAYVIVPKNVNIWRSTKYVGRRYLIIFVALSQLIA